MSTPLKAALVALLVSLGTLAQANAPCPGGNTRDKKGKCPVTRQVQAAPPPAAVASAPAPVVVGACGSNATSFSAEAKDWPTGGAFCAKGTQSSPHIMFPQPGGDIFWSCSDTPCGAKRDAKVTAAPAVVVSQVRVRSHMMSSRVSVPGLPSIVVPVCGGVVGITGTSAVNFESSALTSGAPINAKP